ncbi:MAG: precorrin-2 C(20)-methyltransferase [Fibrobacterota bacterium]|nr:MAG: precorrin-2 C(20)-methyltransferase [Fibrobacterota bacterium]
MNTLYGIGVGPGAPDLLTLRAADVLRRIPLVVGPRPRNGEDSLAARIARPHLSPDCRLEELTFPMVRDPRTLREAWRSAARQIRTWLGSGDVAFLTLGDASLYSTWTYLRSAILELDPTQKVETVPGITSFSASAARTERALAEGDQALIVVPWGAQADRPWLEAALDEGASAAFMKVADRLPGLDDLLRRTRRTNSVLACRVTLPEEEIHEAWQTDPSRSNGYLAVVLSSKEDAP